MIMNWPDCRPLQREADSLSGNLLPLRSLQSVKHPHKATGISYPHEKWLCEINVKAGSGY